MRLVCPNCSSQYEVDAALFPEEGREVQCSNCEHVWIQKPVETEPPMRLDASSSIAPALPSERLSEDERAELADAVEVERQARSHRGFDLEPVDEEEDDAAIVAALREQIKADGGAAEKGGAAKSQKRNLRVAAESVGIDVEEPEDTGRRKWNLDNEDDRKGGPKPTIASRRRDGLRDALERYEEAAAPRRRGGFGAGFITALVLFAIAGGVYYMRGQIAEAYPPASPYLDTYAGFVDDGRVQAEALYAEYSVVVIDQIQQLTSGDDDTGTTE